MWTVGNRKFYSVNLCYCPSIHLGHPWSSSDLKEEFKSLPLTV